MAWANWTKATPQVAPIDAAGLPDTLRPTPSSCHPHFTDPSGVVWRYTFLVEDPGRLLDVTEALRKQGIHASNHYWSAADLLAGEAFANTSHVCPRLLNLWVDEVADHGYVQKSCDVLLNALTGKTAQAARADAA